MQDTSDIEFVIGGKSIHAHKTILVLRCEHFKTMFTGDWKQSTAKLVTVIMHAMQNETLVQSINYNYMYSFLLSPHSLAWVWDFMSYSKTCTIIHMSYHFYVYVS